MNYHGCQAGELQSTYCINKSGSIPMGCFRETVQQVVIFFFFFFFFWFGWFFCFFETGFLCVALAVLELTL
jgi:hypothetical protein